MKLRNIFYLTAVFSLSIGNINHHFSSNISIAAENNSLTLLSHQDSIYHLDFLIRDRINNLSWETKKTPQLAHHAYRGKASWYGPKFHGRRTANGEIFDSNAMTAAHRTLPFGTKVRVTNLVNGRSVIVRINDRGPFIKGRIIDVSAAAARRLNMMNSGVATVQVEILGR